VFVDTFIGGALVLSGQLHAGQHGNAGAVGSMAVAGGGTARAAGVAGAAGAPPQLLSVASLLKLEQLYAEAGLPVAAVADARALQGAWRAPTQRWLADAGPAIALSLHAAACLLDIGTVVIDGSFDASLRDALIAATRDALPRYSWEGVAPPRLVAGSIGADARALGGALLPLYDAFSPDRELFLKAAA
jgi:predicted NBD/HSP70 family sugar kinase